MSNLKQVFENGKAVESFEMADLRNEIVNEIIHFLQVNGL